LIALEIFSLSSNYFYIISYFFIAVIGLNGKLKIVNAPEALSTSEDCLGFETFKAKKLFLEGY